MTGRTESSVLIRFDVIGLFPETVASMSAAGIVGRAIENGLVAVHLHQLCDYTGGSPHPVDDRPYGGGPGMVMRCEPIYRAVEDVRSRMPSPHTVLLSPQGIRFSQAVARRLSRERSVLLFCGRYEGIDERIRPLFDEEISLGDYVLSGGEIAAAALIDATARLLPGVLGSGESAREESFSTDLLEYPQYTRPERFREMAVPGILLSGNHAAVKRWRTEQARERTKRRRPDLSGRDEPEDGNV